MPIFGINMGPRSKRQKLSHKKQKLLMPCSVYLECLETELQHNGYVYHLTLRWKLSSGDKVIVLTNWKILRSWKKYSDRWGFVMFWIVSSMCCVFRPPFGCYVHPKTGWTTFFQPFSTVFVCFKPFSVTLRLKSTKKRLKKNKKTWFCLLIKVGRHTKAGWLPEAVKTFWSARLSPLIESKSITKYCAKKSKIRWKVILVSVL